MPYLILFDIVNGKIEPKSVARIACVRPQEQIVLEFAHQVSSSEVTGLEGCVEAKVATLSFATMAWWPDDHPTHIA